MANLGDPKKGNKKSILIRMGQLIHHAEKHAKKRYEKDLHEASESEKNAQGLQRERAGAIDTEQERQRVYAENNRRAGVNAKPTQHVQARKESGVYNPSLPVAGTSSKKLIRKKGAVAGINRSDAAPHVKKMMKIRMRRSNG